MAAKCFFDVGFEALKDRDLATSQPKYHGNDLSGRRLIAETRDLLGRRRRL
jgi:hypothetical protein